MHKQYSLFLFAAFLLCSLLTESESEAVCRDSHGVDGEDTVSIHSERDESGEWVTTISTWHDSEGPKNNTNLNVKQRIVKCDGKQMVHIKATLRGKPYEPYQEKLRFNSKGGKYAVVGKDGMTLQRINGESSEGHGGVLTNRPLRNDEMFEVRLDKHIYKYKTFLGIGITYHNLKNIDYRDWMMCGTIMLYNNQLYENGDVTKRNYGPNLRTLNIGDRVGLTIKRNGDLHFFVNGVDQGVAISDINYPVYGVLDLYGNTIQVTIV